jgi:plastocyanin
MSRLTLALAIALAAVLTVVAVASAVTKPLPKLVGTVGPDSSFKINLTKGGKKVTKLKPGKYLVVVNDTAVVHNFHLTGPGVNKDSGVAYKKVGKKSLRWTVTLKKGTYRYVCDPHASLMHGSFTVG